MPISHGIIFFPEMHISYQKNSGATNVAFANTMFQKIQNFTRGNRGEMEQSRVKSDRYLAPI